MMTVTVEPAPDPDPHRSSSGAPIPTEPGTTRAWLAHEEFRARTAWMNVPAEQLNGQTLSDLANGGPR
ncbi:hypothetical protein HMPREF0569_0460 [Micrococcus luteus SK58]|uniref:hypothetical protein n=1 Tax=Micrococcus TaxID=1269 RepID=UPI0001C4FA4C|nr:hypothetical protein [Micrococcus luteus]EFD51802.1 hypothetical protein HMPREF0569_0460 [Micrococcus luteus SK58]